MLRATGMVRAVIVLPATAIAGTAHAEARTGFVIGATINEGDVGCQTRSTGDCGTGMHAAGGFSVHAGAMITPWLAVLAEGWGMEHVEDALTATQLLGTAAVRAWPLPRLWVQGGIGAARSTITYASGGASMPDAVSTVPAVAAGIGFEVVGSPSLGVDVELRGASGLYESDVRVYNASLGVGVTFF